MTNDTDLLERAVAGDRDALGRMLQDEAPELRIAIDARMPARLRAQPVTGRSEDALEKAEPHAAAVLTMRDGKAVELRVLDTVFLPLSKGERERVPCPGDKQFELLLHGLFFLDAGRRELYVKDPEDRKKGGDGLQETSKQVPPSRSGSAPGASGANGGCHGGFAADRGRRMAICSSMAASRTRSGRHSTF